MRFPLLLLLLAVACSPASRPENTAVRSFGLDDEQAIRSLMADQESAWDRGDIAGFMAGYADTVVFVSPQGTTRGRDAVTANYMRSYPDASAMGDLTFGINEVVPAGADHAWSTGTWRLVRAADTLSGAYSLLWVRQADGWRIARDHTY
ncbi:MAG: nuclear transport factor 2 family protein [Flavobacteriales bacterium]|nr:nuclear transport factor 2 family protein [Flavobacteriales bacterium]